MSEKTDYFFIVDRYIGISLLPINLLGFIFNSFVFYILTRPKFLKETMFRYFIANEMLDTLFILIGLSSSAKFIFSITKWSDAFSCKIVIYSAEIALMIYLLLSTLISFDRLMAIMYKDIFVFRKKVKFQVLAFISLIGISALANAPIYLYFDVNNSSECVIEDEKAAFYIYLGASVGLNAVPFVIRVFITFIVINYLIQQKKKTHQTKINYKREVSFLKSVLTMDVWIFACYTPVHTFNIFQHAYSINIYNNSLWNLVHTICLVLPSIQASLNIFVFLFCNKLFRKEFQLIMPCCFRKQN